MWLFSLLEIVPFAWAKFLIFARHWHLCCCSPIYGLSFFFFFLYSPNTFFLMPSKGGSCKGDSLPSFTVGPTFWVCFAWPVYTWGYKSHYRSAHDHLCVILRESNPQPFSRENDALTIALFWHKLSFFSSTTSSSCVVQSRERGKKKPYKVKCRRLT